MWHLEIRSICHCSNDHKTLLPVCPQANLFKTERDRVTRALAKEVGDETPVSKVIEGGSDWRGRAQQITLLKAKINDLQQAQVLVMAQTQHNITSICLLPCTCVQSRL